MAGALMFGPWKRRGLAWWALLLVLAAAAGAALLLTNLLLSRLAAGALPGLPPDEEMTEAVAKAVREADASARSDPGSAEAVGALGMTYHAHVFYDRALAAYRRAEELSPDDSRWPYYRSLVLQEHGRIGDLIEALERVVDLDPHDALAWFRLGDARSDRADYAGAAEGFRRAWELSERTPPGESLWERRFPVSAHAAFELSRVADEEGRPEAEMEWLAKAIEMSTFFGPAHRRLGILHERAGRNEEAEAHKDTAANCPRFVPPPDPRLDALVDRSFSSTFLFKYANLMTFVGDTDRAKTLILRAAAVDPGNISTVLSIWRLFRGFGEPEEALPWICRHRRLAPDNPNGERALRECVRALVDKYREEYRLGDAERAVRSAIEECEGDGWLHGFLGEILVELERPEEAIPELRRSLEAEEDRAFRALLGVAIAVQGDPEKAIAEFDKVLADHPTFDYALRNAIPAYLASGRRDKAIDAARRLVATVPDDPTARVTLAKLAVEAGRDEEAVKHLKKALEIDPAYAEARDLLETIGR